MIIKHYRAHFIELLTPIYGEGEAESFFYLIIGDLYSIQRHEIALQPEREFTQEQKEELDRFLAALLKQVPIQYELGAASFYGLRFKVTPDVLIPRPETEELVEWVVQDFEKRERKIRMLDIGTGSGCIAISIAKNLANVEMYAVDVSANALAIARNNAAMNDASVKFLQIDILHPEAFEIKLDVIISNPPYVRRLEMSEIKANVLDYEPHLALFVEDEDPLIFYRAISDFAIKHLKTGGALYFEINQYLGKDMMALLESSGFSNIELRKDIYGNDRMIKAIYS